MNVKKLGDDRLINARGETVGTLEPLGKMGNAPHATADRARSVATPGQILLVRVAVRGQGPVGKPVGARRDRRLNVSHDGLLNRDHHCTRTKKLCPVLQDAPTSNSS